MDFAYTYKPSEVSHTKAKVGDTEKWTAGLELLLDSGKSMNMNHRELIKMDTTILDIEMKKATVTRTELEVSKPASPLPCQYLNYILTLIL